MNLSKDKKTGKWLCQFYYTDWQGNPKKIGSGGMGKGFFATAGK